MSMSVKTSRSGFQRMVVPVFLPRSVGSFFRPPIFSPFSKWREYLTPSRQMEASKYSLAYWGAQEPSPFRPSEQSLLSPSPHYLHPA